MPTSIKTKKLTATVGVELLDVDVEGMLEDPDLPGAILDALEANGVLVLRSLHIDDQAQVAFSRRLGRVEVFRGSDPPEIFTISLDPAKNPAAAYLRGTFDWHIDGLTEDIPIMATILSAHAVAATGGETEFASTYAAYDNLTDDEKHRFETIKVVHTLEATQRRLTPNPTPDQLATWRARPPKEHPLVWRHVSGRRSLVLGPTADHIVGMDPGEGRALLDDLMERSTRSHCVYRHEWQVGDLVIWDNRGVLHRALPYDPTSARDMHRTTLFGDERIAS